MLLFSELFSEIRLESPHSFCIKALRIWAYLISERITYGRSLLIAIIGIINSIHFQLRLINLVPSPCARNYSLQPVRHRHKRASKFRRLRVEKI